MPILTTFIQYGAESSSQNNSAKRNKNLPTFKEELKLSPFAYSMILCRNPQQLNQKSVRLINEFKKVAGHKIYINKSLELLNTNNKVSGREIKNTIPLTITPKRTKYLGINLSKEVKDVYTKSIRQW